MITCRSGKDLCARGEFQRCGVWEGDVGGSPGGGERPRMRWRQGGRPQGIGGGGLASMEARAKTLSPPLCLSFPPSFFL